MPFVVIVLFLDPEKNMEEAPATIDIDALKITSPVRCKAAGEIDPENPVQLKLFICVVPLIVNVPEPAVMLALMFLGNPARKPMVTVREFAPEYVKFTVGMARNIAVVPPVQRLVAPSPTMLI
jgi:hypothetical protein